MTYQPVVTLESRRLVGIEAALSWQHPQRGMLSHEQGRQAAERSRAPAAAIRTVTGKLASVGGGYAEDNVRVLTELGMRARLYDFGGGFTTRHSRLRTGRGPTHGVLR